MIYELEVYKKNPEIYIKDIEVILPQKKIKVEFSKLYLFEDNNLNSKDLKKAAEILFCDPVAEDYKINIIKNKKDLHKNTSTNSIFDKWIVKVYYKPEVTDPSSEVIIKALELIKIKVNNISVGKKYILKGRKLKFSEVELLTRRLFANYIIEDAIIRSAK